VNRIQGRYKKLMSILLLITRQMLDLEPDLMQKVVGHVGRTLARVKLLKQLNYLADQTNLSIIIIIIIIIGKT
jgi:hypothetical protein